jgi:proteasome beta subunit
MPYFAPGDDPGPDFAALLRRAGLAPAPIGGNGPDTVADRLPITHATTVVAIRYSDGVVMAGDRRATSGNLISHRAIEKVFPADRHSGVAIAGAAGPAMEMVKLFQLQLEHYEKVEGSALSLEGKANQLGQMVRGNLGAAMQGLAVVPLFAGFDLRRTAGRLFQYDVTGGRYEESNFAATGSGSLHAGTVVKLGFREGLDRGEALDLAIRALFTAADDDSATGGPDLVRGIYPTVATITGTGFDKLADIEVAERFAALLETLASREAAIPGRLSETSTDTSAGTSTGTSTGAIAGAPGGETSS